MMHRRVAIGTAILLTTSATVAQANPSKELDVYKGNLGKYMCDGKKNGTGQGFKATVEHTVEFDGLTYIERYSEMKSADHPTPWKGIFIMSYDPDSKRWVRNGVDNSGMRNAASSSGWKGNQWVWENDNVNIVIDKKNANAYNFAVDVKKDGEVNRVMEAACKKV